MPFSCTVDLIHFLKLLLHNILRLLGAESSRLRSSSTHPAHLSSRSIVLNQGSIELRSAGIVLFYVGGLLRKLYLLLIGVTLEMVVSGLLVKPFDELVLDLLLALSSQFRNMS